MSGVLERRAQRSAHQLGTGGKDDVGAFRNGLLDQFVGVFARNGVIVGLCLDLAGEDLVKLAAAEFVLAGPGAGFGRALVHKGDLEVFGGRAGADGRGQDAVDELDLVRLGRFGAELDRHRLLDGEHVVPDGVERLSQLGRAALFEVCQRVDADEQQQHIADRRAHVFAAAGMVRLLDPVVQRDDVGAVVVAPFFAGGLAQRFLQAGKAALLGEGQRIQAAQRVIFHKFIVQADLLVVAVLRHHAGDGGRNGVRLEIFQHADALVALLHIEAAEVFKAADGVADAFLHMGLAQRDPLAGEFGIRLQQGHEVGGKRRRAPGRLGAHKQLKRDFHRADGQLAFDIGALQDIVQHRQVRVLAGRHLFAVIFLCSFPGAQILFSGFHTIHRSSLLLALADISVFPAACAAYSFIVPYSCALWKRRRAFCRRAPPFCRPKASRLYHAARVCQAGGCNAAANVA